MASRTRAICLVLLLTVASEDAVDDTSGFGTRKYVNGCREKSKLHFTLEFYGLSNWYVLLTLPPMFKYTESSEACSHVEFTILLMTLLATLFSVVSDV